jgi:hypothetical protein
MEYAVKLSIYRGIIRYLLETTNYTLKNIAELSGALIDHIRSIYCENHLPYDFTAEEGLVRLYLTVLTLSSKPSRPSRYFIEINKIID